MKHTRLYLFKFKLNTGEIIIKIGKSSWRSTKANAKQKPSSLPRFLQVLASMHTNLRYCPMAKIKRDRQVDEKLVFKYENILHLEMQQYKYIPEKKHDGSDELFLIPSQKVEEMLLERYEMLTKGKKPP